MDTRSISKREDIKELLDLYSDLLATNQYEIVSLVVNFYIDFINIKPFKNETEITGLLLIYVLLFREWVLILYITFAIMNTAIIPQRIYCRYANLNRSIGTENIRLSLLKTLYATFPPPVNVINPKKKEPTLAQHKMICRTLKIFSVFFTMYQPFFFSKSY